MAGVENRTAIITGAGRGLGRSHALLLASRGARVVVNDLPSSEAGRVSAAEAVVAEIQAGGGEAVADHSDISTPAGGAALVSSAVQTYGKVDIVINNAGVLRDSTFHKMRLEDWTIVLKVHLDGAFHVTHAAWPHLRNQGFGRVVLTTSGAGTFGNFGQANYASAKLGLVGLANTLAIEGAKYGITVNTVSPVAATRMTSGLLPPGELFDPAFVSSAVAHLVSEECRTSGEIIRAGGGTLSRVAYVVSRGVSFDRIPTVEEIAQRWESILDMTGAGPGRVALEPQ